MLLEEGRRQRVFSFRLESCKSSGVKGMRGMHPQWLVRCCGGLGVRVGCACHGVRVGTSQEEAGGRGGVAELVCTASCRRFEKVVGVVRG